MVTKNTLTDIRRQSMKRQLTCDIVGEHLTISLLRMI